MFQNNKSLADRKAFILPKKSSLGEDIGGLKFMKVAVVGATGLVGTKMLQILEERNFPVDELIPVAS